MRLRRGNLATLVLAAVVTSVGCASNRGPTGVSLPTVSREWVTGAAAAALGPDGRFVLPLPANGGPLAISESDARAQAVAWARLVATIPTTGGTDWFAPGGSGLERDYGGKISFADLRDCHRAVYAQSAYGPIPEGVPRFLLNAFGSYWVVRLCSPAEDIPVVLAVAVNSGLVVSGGRLQPPPSGAATGNEFRAVAVPRGTPVFRVLPLEPEAAVAFAYRTTGRRVSEVPVFVQRVADSRPDPFYAQFGYWRLTLEGPVHAVGQVSGAEYDTRDIAVFWPSGAGSDTTLRVALAAQPDTALYVPYPISPDTVSGQTTQAVARLAVRAPYRFETIRVAGR